MITLQTITAARVAAVLHAIYPHATIRVEGAANAVVVIAPPDDIVAMRSIVTAIDIKNPTAPTVEAITLRIARPDEAARRLQPLYPHARFTVGPNHTLLVQATPQTMSEVHAVIASLDAPPIAPTPKPLFPATIFHIAHGEPGAIARAAAHAAPNVRLLVSGSDVLAIGPPDAVAQLKPIIAQLDHAPAGTRYTEVYRIVAVDAHSIADFLSRSFRDADFVIDGSLNSISVTATAHVQSRIADAIQQLDVPPGSAGPNQPAGSFGGSQTQVVQLRAAVPGAAGSASTSAADIAQTVTQVLGPSASDLHITVQPNSTRLILAGSDHSIEAAERLIAKLDIAEPLVELDTVVYEVDETVQKQLGFKFPTASLSTTYSELTPSTTASGATPQLLSLQALTRTPLSLQAELDFLVSTSQAKILEDPRITTFSGRTASLRAGETVNILTTAGGGTGTVATTQVQSFQTGVTLDITPVVNADNYVTVSLHPSVNSIAAISAAGVPNIQTRDTTTTIGLHDGETLVIGGLIEDSDTRTVQKIPFLGDLPLIGRLFQDTGVQHTRNELIVTVTPHILNPGQMSGSVPPLAVPSIAPLPTLEPTATLPPTRARDESLATPGGMAARVPSIASSEEPTPAPQLSESPAPVPSAFGQTNIFSFGAAPANNFASNDAPPQIFFIQAGPTVVKPSQPVTISVITTSNVTSLSLGPSTLTPLATLTSIGTGKWQSTFNFNQPNLPASEGTINEVLTATTALGASTSVRIPFTLNAQ